MFFSFSKFVALENKCYFGEFGWCKLLPLEWMGNDVLLYKYRELCVIESLYCATDWRNIVNQLLFNKKEFKKLKENLRIEILAKHYFHGLLKQFKCNQKCKFPTSRRETSSCVILPALHASFTLGHKYSWICSPICLHILFPIKK